MAMSVDSKAATHPGEVRANRLGIEMLTLLGMPPVEHVRLAAELGCVSISTGLMGLPLHLFGYPDLSLYPAWSLENDPALRRELKAALRDTGVHVGLGEGFRVRADADLRDSGAALDIMAELGARRINAVSMEPDMGRTYDQLALLADMVVERGMRFIVEFAPPNAISTLHHALAAVAYIGHERAQVMLDSMHFFRSGGRIEDIQALAPCRIGYAQMCDAPLVSQSPSYMQEAMFARLPPGAGELPLRAWLAALPADLEIGLEVPMIADLQAGMSPHDHAARVVAAARALGA
jgi:sugar phosphate isomerase/epimerase